MGRKGQNSDDAQPGTAVHTSPVQITVNVKEGAEATTTREQAPPSIPQLEDQADDATPDLPAYTFLEDQEEEEPEYLSPLDLFLHKFSTGGPYRFNLTRLPDPAEHEGRWLKKCEEDEHWPSIPFRHDSLGADIHKRLKSGGKVRVQLFFNGSYVKGGSITFLIADPDITPAAASQDTPTSTPTPQPQAPPADVQPPLQDNFLTDFQRRFQNVMLDEMEKRLRGEQPEPKPQATSEKPLSPQEQLTLTIAEQSDLLPTVLRSITAAVASVQQTAQPPNTLGDRILNLVDRNPQLQRRALNTFDRVMDRFFPVRRNGNDYDDEGGTEVSLEELQNQLMDYVVGRCAARQPVSFNDPLFKEFADAAPEQYQDLLESLAGLSPKIIIKNVLDYWPQHAEVLRSEHAPGWILQYLKKPAEALTAESES